MLGLIWLLHLPLQVLGARDTAGVSHAAPKEAGFHFSDGKLLKGVKWEGGREGGQRREHRGREERREGGEEGTTRHKNVGAPRAEKRPRNRLFPGAFRRNEPGRHLGTSAGQVTLDLWLLELRELIDRVFSRCTKLCLGQAGAHTHHTNRGRDARGM